MSAPHDFWAAERVLMLACPRCQAARAEIARRGCRASSVPDHGDAYCAAQSVELAGPGTYGAAREYVQIRAPSCNLCGSPATHSGGPSTPDVHVCASCLHRAQAMIADDPTTDGWRWRELSGAVGMGVVR